MDIKVKIPYNVKKEKINRSKCLKAVAEGLNPNCHKFLVFRVTVCAYPKCVWSYTVLNREDGVKRMMDKMRLAVFIMRKKVQSAADKTTV